MTDYDLPNLYEPQAKTTTVAEALSPRRETVAERPKANPVSHMSYLQEVSEDDVAGLRVAEIQYGSSWKKRGGVGAFMMLSRKWDRLETALSPLPSDPSRASLKSPVPVAPWDIFGAIAADPRAEGIIDDIRDLRRYLLLVESEMRAKGATSARSEHRDNTGQSAPFGYTEEDDPEGVGNYRG